MMNEYKSESNAARALQRLRKKLIKKQCPIYKNNCLGAECMSFYKGCTRKVSVIWKINEPYCHNAIVIGTIEMEMP